MRQAQHCSQFEFIGRNVHAQAHGGKAEYGRSQGVVVGASLENVRIVLGMMFMVILAASVSKSDAAPPLYPIMLGYRLFVM